MEKKFELPEREAQIQSNILAKEKTQDGYKTLSYVENFERRPVEYVTRLVKTTPQYEETLRETSAYEIDEAKAQYASISKKRPKLLVDVTGQDKEFTNIRKAKCRKTGEMYDVSITYDRRGADVFLSKKEWTEKEMDEKTIWWHDKFDDENYIPYKETYNV